MAFSGGVDSAFLVYAAHEALGGKLLAITAVTQSYPRHEAADAAKILAKYGVKHEEITLDQLAIPGFCGKTEREALLLLQICAFYKN